MNVFNLLQENIRRISQERQQLTQQLKDETHQKEQLKQIKKEMENERWQLNKTVEELQVEVWVHSKEAAGTWISDRQQMSCQTVKNSFFSNV